MSRYRIRNVAELSGVPAATLRAWERRYGVPAPARSASAYRLYDDRDLALVKEMRDLIASGLATGEAAAAVSSGRAAAGGASAGAPPDAFTVASERIVDATIRFDAADVDREVGAALALGPAVAVFDRALAPALRRIGDLWRKGEITIAQEHLTARVIETVAAHLLRLAQREEGARVAVLACFADEEHVIPLLGAGLHLADWGFRTLVLGARTPPAAVARAVEVLAPSLVALSVTIAPAPQRARALVDAYADACRTTTLVVGGAGSAAMSALIERRGAIVTVDLEARRTDIERAVRGSGSRRRTRLTISAAAGEKRS